MRNEGTQNRPRGTQKVYKTGGSGMRYRVPDVGTGPLRQGRGGTDHGEDAEGDGGGADQRLHRLLAASQESGRVGEGDRDYRREQCHAEDRSDPEHGDIEQAEDGGRHHRRGQDQQGGGAGHPVHQPDQQGADRERLGVLVPVGVGVVAASFAPVAVGMDVDGAFGVTVDVEVDTVADQPPQHVAAEQHQHGADAEFQRRRQFIADGSVEQDHGAGEQHQRRRMAEPPDDAVANDAVGVFLPRHDAGDGGDVIRLHGVLHADEESEEKRCDHRGSVDRSGHLAAWFCYSSALAPTYAYHMSEPEH